MYLNFYRLKEKPFELTPSNRFLYFGESHKEALSLLTYGVRERKGFILLTGEVGTGKTTMVRTLLSSLEENVRYVYLSNPILTPLDLMNYIALKAFDENTQLNTKAEFLYQFEQFLNQIMSRKESFVLIIDEAHKLSFDLLEEIRLLSNLESQNEKLITIFLAGQPELNEKLRDPQCRALLQRITNRHHIDPLGLKDTEEYIFTRLKVAGAEDYNDIFSSKAIKAIHHYSEGYPRMINNLADNCLLLGYSIGKNKIDIHLVEQSFMDLELKVSFTKDALKPPAPYKMKPLGLESSKPQMKRIFLVLSISIILLIAILGINQRGRNTFFQVSRFLPIKNQESISSPKVKDPDLGIEVGRLQDDVLFKAEAAENMKATPPMGSLKVNPFRIPYPQKKLDVARLPKVENLPLPKGDPSILAVARIEKEEIVENGSGNNVSASLVLNQDKSSILVEAPKDKDEIPAGRKPPVATISGAPENSKVNTIRQVQRFLREKGYYTQRIDGIAGTFTKRAIRNFQRDFGLEPDGIAGVQTLKKMTELKKMQ